MKLEVIKGYWTNFWRFWSVKFQIVCALISGWITFDTGSVLMAWQMLPWEVRGVLPSSVVTTIGAVFFVLNFATIAARGVPQPKAQAKMEAKQHGE